MTTAGFIGMGSRGGGPLGHGPRTKPVNNVLDAAPFALAHDVLATGAVLVDHPR